MNAKRALAFGPAIFLAGCMRAWDHPDLKTFAPAAPAPAAASCQTCHEEEYGSWQKTRHADKGRMEKIPEEGLRQCSACHEVKPGHAEEPAEGTAVNPSRLSKTEQNTLCGKCHYNQDYFGRRAINPKDRHALFMDVGLEGRKKQLSCLDCHAGHSGKSAMLTHSKANICFKCHKSAMVTMGAFQPVNWLSAGKACQACHTVHGGSTLFKTAKMATGVCVVCHFVGVAVAD
ncbi:MAG: hypothetical protein HY924_05915 [Elusimicrobia bacterium]|nr:hypothetical protein [Elusimicrobiota bacterium]